MTASERLPSSRPLFKSCLWQKKLAVFQETSGYFPAVFVATKPGMWMLGQDTLVSLFKALQTPFASFFNMMCCMLMTINITTSKIFKIKLAQNNNKHVVNIVKRVHFG